MLFVNVVKTCPSRVINFVGLGFLWVVFVFLVGALLASWFSSAEAEVIQITHRDFTSNQTDKICLIA